jgi:hypothetical protein
MNEVVDETLKEILGKDATELICACCHLDAHCSLN